jgi:hypothetical protein
MALINKNYLVTLNQRVTVFNDTSGKKSAAIKVGIIGSQQAFVR